MSAILEIQHLTKTYDSGERHLTVLHDVNFTLQAGDTCSIVGPSGSGKTTLLGLCAGLDRASSGSVILNGVKLDNMSEDERAQVRNQFVGFVFQNFQLIPTLTALENVMVPLELRGERNVQKQAMDLLGRVGLAERADHYPTQLSGGEQQRVSIARAFSNRPTILFADEPTGNLDEETGTRVEQLLFDLNKEAGTTLVLVTHDLELAERTNRIIRIKGGHIVSDEATALIRN
ncbi:ABC transporter ATP-binding protein [Pontibacter fetidus]|uniref:ABC transporter ATP-binding protein n=1 Tax=Pontibacter fetidus TaxID=2700082 RepID=A0A6B2GX54_9BACT|nr:ABC transporter ATP-binding protein [Pontibacter fetidus]NDK54438.1 ABC transporter ATP-binding protein [Pontibacter fetidus]